jgi:hypothetical protein
VLVRDAEARFVKKARADLAAFVKGIDAELVGAGMVGGNPKPLPPFETILKSHPLVHAAEAELYRRTFAAAGEAVLGAPPMLVPVKELTERACAALHLSAAKLGERLAVMGKSSGKPWTVDQKEAALVACIALAGA